MIKTHEINLEEEDFNKLLNDDYIISSDNTIEQSDFILFRKFSNTEDTGLYQLTQVKDSSQNSGLKDNYKVILLRKI